MLRVTPRLPSSRPCARQSLTNKHVVNRSTADGHDCQRAAVAVLAMPVDAVGRLPLGYIFGLTMPFGQTWSKQSDRIHSKRKASSIAVRASSLDQS